MRNEPVPIDNAKLARRFFSVGVLILVAGLTAAATVYWGAIDDSAAQVIHDSIYGKQYDFQLERTGGKVMVLMLRFTHWFGGLWHGKPLAAIIAGAALFFGVACLLVGRRLAELARRG